MNPSDARLLRFSRLLYPTIQTLARDTAAITDAERILPEDVKGVLRAWLQIASRMYDNHDLLTTNPDRLQRFWDRIDMPDAEGRVGYSAPCWLSHWARQGKDGPSVVSWGGKNQYAHRIAWELLHGRPLAPNERLRRYCHEPRCCNVDQHYRLVRAHESPLPTPKTPSFMESLAEAVRGERYCRRGHTLRPGQVANNCAGCRRERRAAAARQRDAELQGLSREYVPLHTSPTTPIEPESDFDAEIAALLTGMPKA